MKKVVLMIVAAFLSLPVLATSDSDEKPTQHLKVADVTSMDEAKDTFLATTLEIKGLGDVGLEEAAKIHVITYTLEKSVAYFSENLTGEKQSIAKEMAVVVEDIHITSENNRMDELHKHLDTYYGLVDRFLFDF